MVYHDIPWYTILYHGVPWYHHFVTHRSRTMVYRGLLHGKPWYIIPHGITMVKPRGITTWSYHGNTSVLVHHGVPWYTMVYHGTSYHGIQC